VKIQKLLRTALLAAESAQNMFELLPAYRRAFSNIRHRPILYQEMSQRFIAQTRQK
jgi:hypothetical protein